MSNMSLNMSQHRLQTPLTQSQSGTGVTTPKTAPKPPSPSVLGASAYRELYGGKSPGTDANTGLGDAQLKSMGQMIDSSEPQLIRKRSEQIPKPSLSLSLSQSTGIQPDLTVTPPSTQTLPTVTTPTTTPPSTTNQPPLPKAFHISDLNFKDKDLSLARFTYVQAEKQFNRDKGPLVSQALHDDLQPLLKELSKADKGIGGISQSDQKNILDRAKKQARDIVAATGKRDELGMAFSRHNDDELKQLVTKLVTEIRDDKAGSYDQLSAKKKAFVDAVVAGIKDGRRAKNRPEFTKDPCALVKAEAAIKPAFQKMLERANLNQGQLAALQVPIARQKAIMLQGFIGAGGERLKTLTLEALNTYHPPLQARTTPPHVTEIGPDDLGDGVKQALAGLSQTPDAVHMNGAKQALDTQLKALGKDHNTLWQLSIMSDSQLKALLQKGAGGDGSTTPIAPPLDDELVKEIRQLLPNKASDTTVKLDKFDVPETMEIGDKKYQAHSHIFTSGFGATFRYVNVSDPTDIVAVKILSPNDEKKPEDLHADTVKELNLHRELQGPDGHGNVIGLKGAVPGPNQSICIVMEYAGGGGLDKLATQIHEELKANRISKESAQLLGLAILKQSLESVNYMHEDRQMLHSDLKNQNMMLGSDGQVKMIDFGTAHVGPERFLQDRIVDQPRFLAPEQTGDMTGAGTLATSKSDMWSVGTMAYNLLIGNQNDHPFFAGELGTQIEKRIQEHMNNPQSRLMDHTPGWQQTPANKPLEDLINGLMMPHPEQRLSARDALQSPLFQDPRLSSDAMKQIMKDLATPPDPNLPKDQEGQQRFNTVRQALNTLASS